MGISSVSSRPTSTSNEEYGGSDSSNVLLHQIHQGHGHGHGHGDQSSPTPTSSTASTLDSSYKSQTIQATTYILGWYIFSLSISIYNKWMFGPGLDFKYPIIITAFHQLCLFLLSGTILYLRPGLRPYVNANLSVPWSVYVRSLVPCALASAGDIGLSNVSISMISLSLYTMLKTSSLMFVLIFGLIFKLEKFHWKLIVICCVMVLSVVMMTSKPPTATQDGTASDEADDSSGLGILLVLTASCLSGLRWSFTQILLKSNPYTPNSITTIFYISPTMCLVLFALGLSIEGWGNFTSSPIWATYGITSTIFLLFIPGILAFMMTLCEFKLLGVARIITLSVAGIFKELLTILLSAIIFGDRLSLVNCLGLVLTFADILWYNWYRFSVKDPGYERVESEVVDKSEEVELDDLERRDDRRRSRSGLE
ncbi:uncharacterized protein LODBEIA_P60120 [Lodderomyces beijingensis]|uniref:Sugar phosphate transporter domain-containing protein n=1 Tax=Lodderomyces beijingensis TaxID=1775926 RepID=A0ABP0ZUH1_9ASCO